ncbi:hypothetical protein GS491_26955 [Rhodococcus hoagii]|nr:hypothetical protein [Prescottella equi]
MMLEGAGHRATNALERNRPAPNDLQAMADLSGLVAHRCDRDGSVGRTPARAAPLSDFVIWSVARRAVHRGPATGRRFPGEQIDKQTLGGPQVAIDTSGVAHNLAESDDAALALARRYLSYFPSSAWQRPPWVGPDGATTTWGAGSTGTARPGPCQPEATLRLRAMSRPSRTRAPSPRFSRRTDVDHHRAGAHRWTCRRGSSQTSRR